MDYRSEPLARYLEDAASAQPTPGGGSVAAVAGALASTMASMAAGFTAGKEKFRDVQGAIEEALAGLAGARDRLLELAHEDMQVYQAIMAAYRLPRETDAQKAARQEGVRAATKRSLGVVMGVMGGCLEVLRTSRRLAEIANPNLISDVGVAGELALGAARAVQMNVEVNLSGYTDAADASAVRAEAEAMLGEAERLAGETRRIVLEKLRR